MTENGNGECEFIRAPLGFELSLVERLILGRESFIFHSELFKFGFEGFEFPLCVEGQVSLPIISL